MSWPSDCRIIVILFFGEREVIADIQKVNVPGLSRVSIGHFSFSDWDL